MEEYLKGKALYGATSEELTKFRLAFAKSGRKGFLQEDLKTAIASSKGHYVDPYSIAELYARLDEKDQAFQWLERAYQERSHHVPLIDTNPSLTVSALTHDSRTSSTA